MQNRFNFVGTVSFPKDDSKRPFFHEFTKNNKRMRSLNFGIKSDGHNMGFVEMFGMEQDVIRARNEDNESVEISWEDRFDEEAINSVAGMYRNFINLGEGFERQTFLSSFDAIGYLKENLRNLGDRVIVATGRITKQFYNGKVYDRYQLQNIFIRADESTKPKLNVTIELAFDKDCIDKSDWKTNRKLYIDGYTQTYIDKDHGYKWVSQRMCFDASKINPENEDHVSKMNCRLKYINVTGKKVYRMAFEGYLINGSETVEFDESQLTDAQREAVALGLKSLEDYRPRGQILGERIQEFRIKNPYLYGEYADGNVETDMTMSTFEEDMVYTPPKEEKIEDVIKETKPEVSKVDEIDDDDLF